MSETVYTAMLLDCIVLQVLGKWEGAGQRILINIKAVNQLVF